jgi:hypothetical protein
MHESLTGHQDSTADSEAKLKRKWVKKEHLDEKVNNLRKEVEN